MTTAACTIVVERRADGRFRATCHLLPDCEVVADTEDEARERVEAALAEDLRRRAERDEQAQRQPPP